MNLSIIQQSNVSIKILRLINLNNLKQILITDNDKNSTLFNTVIELELNQLNYQFDSDQIINFLYQFKQLKSITLNLINFQKMPTFNVDNKCLPWKRLIFNHQCKHHQQLEKQQPLRIDEINQFDNLCSIQWLDLSCMNIEYINPLSIQRLFQRISDHSHDDNEMIHLHLDLSYNSKSLNIDQLLLNKNKENVFIEY